MEEMKLATAAESKPSAVQAKAAFSARISGKDLPAGWVAYLRTRSQHRRRMILENTAQTHDETK